MKVHAFIFVFVIKINKDQGGDKPPVPTNY